ncbi:MAG: GNAT family N-acetyltransferase [Propionibacteriales bacterium]|nr:GNAT family N-acetyltransferase [Propionibacteriales bacterium]
MTSPTIDWPRRTDRLSLRPLRPDDLDQLFKISADPEVSRWLLDVVTDPERYRVDQLNTLNDPTNFSSVIEREGAIIGEAFGHLQDAMGQSVADPDLLTHREASIGYVLDPAHAGNGYATEVTAELLRMAFDELGVRRVTAGCFADNRASVRVLEKNGFRREQYGVADSWHAELGWIDGCTYAILEQQWRAAAAG